MTGRTAKRSGSGSSTGTQSGATPDSTPLGSGQFYRAVYETARANGQQPTDYLVANYKKLGIPKDRLADYAAAAERQAQQDAMEQAHVRCRLEVYEDMWHVFQMGPFKTAVEAIHKCGEFIYSVQ